MGQVSAGNLHPKRSKGQDAKGIVGLVDEHGWAAVSRLLSPLARLLRWVGVAWRLPGPASRWIMRENKPRTTPAGCSSITAQQAGKLRVSTSNLLAHAVSLPSHSTFTSITRSQLNIILSTVRHVPCCTMGCLKAADRPPGLARIQVSELPLEQTPEDLVKVVMMVNTHVACYCHLKRLLVEIAI